MTSIADYARETGIPASTMGALLDGRLKLPRTKAGFETLKRLGLKLAFRVIATGEIIPHDEVRTYLARQLKSWQTVQDYVDHYRVNRKQFEFVLQGKRSVPKTMIPALGWEIVYLIQK